MRLLLATAWLDSPRARAYMSDRALREPSDPRKVRRAEMREGGRPAAISAVVNGEAAALSALLTQGPAPTPACEQHVSAGVPYT